MRLRQSVCHGVTDCEPVAFTLGDGVTVCEPALVIAGRILIRGRSRASIASARIQDKPEEHCLQKHSGQLLVFVAAIHTRDQLTGQYPTLQYRGSDERAGPMMQHARARYGNWKAFEEACDTEDAGVKQTRGASGGKQLAPSSQA